MLKAMLTSARLPAASAGLALAAVAGFAIALSAPELTISRGIANALDEHYSKPLPDGTDDAIFNKAHLHLSSLMLPHEPNTSVSPFMSAVSPGDRITVNSHDGTLTTYQVTAVTPLPPTTAPSAKATPTQIAVVTALAIDANQPRTVRFMIQVPAQPPNKIAPRPVSQHSL
jgi:hypothetical protein